MADVFDIVDPLELQAFIRELDPSVYGFTLDRFLPNTDIQAVDWEFIKIDQTRRRMASYRNFDVEADIGERPGFAKVNGEIPPMSRKYPLGEEQKLRLRELQGQSGLVADQIFNDAAMATESVQARIEFARGDALFNGSISMTNDRGLVAAKVDYTVVSSVTALTVPSILWDIHATATPIADMQQMVFDYMAANNNLRPAYTLMSLTTFHHILACAEVKSALQFGSITPTLVTPEQLASIMASHQLPEIVVYDTVVNVNGTNTRVTPLKSIAMLPPVNTGNFGETVFGVTAEAIESINRGVQSIGTAPGLTGTTWSEPDPVRTWTKVSAMPLPVIKDPAKIGTAAVVT